MIVCQFISRGITNSHLYAHLKRLPACQTMTRPSSDLAAFRKIFSKAQSIAVITGAGVSAESGVPTFRGAGGYWRKWEAQSLASPETFSRNPSRVWEFYHYRREVMLTKDPNPAHLAIAECEERLSKQGRTVTVITQNVDRLHRRAGSKNILEIHGNLFRTRCMSCGHEADNYKSPICTALEGKGAPDPKIDDANIPVQNLPRCEQKGCNGLLRPAVVWFGEALDSDILTRAEQVLDSCDLCLVVGTSSVVYPAAMFAPHVAARKVPVAEFNMENTPATERFKFHFHGPCGSTLPPALARHETETEED
ncbi:NAD-dependent protein deacylase sirtuin-5A%2C mitochondrial-like [Xyrichtys novacula]|uniref:NAD-dependent protein deacylase sirtuin-5, mitochondrial n=1 Tax=Xyrichtys novacula TaxID=13765 RepID=A0AAV1FKD4_XYRNO|nr:NAD-dependent protein deacylase sirtuin-5A%2C mitochondrial-like [Xyrichtys novacula]